MENPGKINFPGKSWKICEKLKVMEKKLNGSSNFPNKLKIVPLVRGHTYNFCICKAFRVANH